MIEFNPNDLNEEPIQSGVYDFFVAESRERASNSAKNKGKLYIELKVTVSNETARKTVYDRFSGWLQPWKLKGFCEACGVLAELQSGELRAENNGLSGLKGKCHVGIEASDKGPKNIITKYIVPQKPTEAKTDANSAF